MLYIKVVSFLLGKKVIPGGVNSSVRTFKAVGHQILQRAKGAYMIEDGNRLIDYQFLGPMIFGSCLEPLYKQ
jgi:glutamate-1-semialdehyde aminotransferase